MDKQKKNMLMILASMGSVTTTVVLLLLKAFAFIGTGSVAILSSLFDSVQDFMTSLINMVAVRHAIRPADTMHRFGHGKAQGIGCLLQAFIIAGSSVLLLVESILHLIDLKEVQHVSLGIIVIVISLILTGLLVTFQNYVVRQTGSLSIKADRAHYSGDVLMNIGVVISLVASSYFGVRWVDGVFGIGVSLYLFYSVWYMMQEACALLMDHELSSEIRQDIRRQALSIAMVKSVSGLKTREGGNRQFVQFNVQFDGKVSLQEAHDSLDEIEQLLRKKYPDMEVIIHAEPTNKQGARKK